MLNRPVLYIYIYDTAIPYPRYGITIPYPSPSRRERRTRARVRSAHSGPFQAVFSSARAVRQPCAPARPSLAKLTPAALLLFPAPTCLPSYRFSSPHVKNRTKLILCTNGFSSLVNGLLTFLCTKKICCDINCNKRFVLLLQQPQESPSLFFTMELRMFLIVLPVVIIKGFSSHTYD